MNTEQTKTESKDCIASTNTPKLSNRQLKKLKKYEEQRKTLMARRIRHRKRLKARKASGEKVGTSRKFLKSNKVDMEKSKISFAIDLDFEDLMIDRDLANCCKQLGRVYAINRRSTTPCPLWLTSLKPNSRTDIQLQKNNYKSWDIEHTPESYLNIGFQKDKIVYLTSESDTILNQLEENTIYVIGGLVDHNFHKGICFKRAQEAGVRTAKLPLSEFIDIKTRTVLTINHVFEIISKVVEGVNWQDAILSVLPPRKRAIAKEKPEDTNDNELTNLPSNKENHTD
ncbi:tRNA methyltransferase 10 homolog A [Culicoides brevitarsis]|uniref:tRNA methyltransferase 10 homolog A n=1 Tax=Culicoides brevitarsis TaxID=469753 RepID=UPI00307B587E